jgi:hypothetical protein
MNGDQRSVGELISDAINQFSALVRNEVALARAEIASKASAAAMGIGLVAAGAIVAIPALVLLLFALAAGLMALGMSPGFAYLAVAILAFVVSGVLVFVGLQRLSAKALKPTRTIAEIHRDIAAVKE